MKIFNRAVKNIQRERSAFKFNVDYLKDEVAARIADRLLDIKRDLPNVLDYMSGSGHIIKHLDSNDQIKNLTLSDTSQSLLNKTFKSEVNNFNDILVKKKLIKSEYVDNNDSLMMEILPFKNEEFDCVVSNLSMHWENDLLGALCQIKNVLKYDGVFIGALFGGETLYELRHKTALQLAETERKGGISPHISPMADFKDMGSLLSRAGFSLTTVDLDEIVVSYPTMLDLLEDVKNMGENNASLNAGVLNKDILLAADAIYRNCYGNDDQTIPATFQIIYLIGWRPHASQPKPLKRGSGKISLKEVIEEKNIDYEKKI